MFMDHYGPQPVYMPEGQSFFIILIPKDITTLPIDTS